MTGKLHDWIRDRLLQFRDDARGATAILFAMLAVPVFALGLAAIDYARVQGSKTAIQDAADAAARAGANMLGAPHSEIEDAVRGYLRTNLPKDRTELPFVLTFAPEDTALTVKLNTTVPTSMLGIVGVNEFAVAVESTAERPDPVKELMAPHRGVTPELPPEIAKQVPGLDRHVSPDDLRQAQQLAQQIMQQLEQSGGGAEVEQLLRGLKGLQ